MSEKTISQRPLFDTALARNACIRGANLEWEAALHLAVRRTYPKDAIIPHRESPGIYYIAKGVVLISYIAPCGHERKTLYIKAGTLCNEARSLTGYEPGGRFTCLQDVELYCFPENILTDLDFIRSYPHLILSLMRSMANKMLIHYSFLADMGTGSPLIHIARFLLALAINRGHTTRFKAEVTQQELADLLGIHRTHLARLLRQLKEMGILDSFTSRDTRIADMAKLVQLAEGSAFTHK